MWFKQIQLFQYSGDQLSAERLAEKLEPLKFIPCLPSMQQSIGWVSPVDEEDAPLVRAMNGYMMICFQVEEKILPSTVIRQELSELIKQMETSENRKLRQKEKYELKDQITLTLLPRAFSKFTRIYAYIDPQNQWLVLGTTNAKKTEQFISSFKKAITEEIYPIDVRNISPIMTNWLKHQNYSSSFSIEKACVLQDPNQESRIIRCKQQDLFANGIQSLVKDGCDVVQLALCWQDRVNFVLANDFSINSIQFHDEITAQAKEMEPETKQQQFDADFFIMSATLTELLKELVEAMNTSSSKNVVSMAKIG